MQCSTYSYSNSEPVAQPKDAPGLKFSSVGHGFGCSDAVTMFSREKELFLALFLMLMDRRLGFTMETMVCHGPHGRSSHITAECSDPPRRNEVTHLRNSYYE